MPGNWGPFAPDLGDAFGREQYADDQAGRAGPMEHKLPRQPGRLGVRRGGLRAYGLRTVAARSWHGKQAMRLKGNAR